MFLYYSSKSAAPMGSEYMLNMGLSDWLSFCADAGIVDNSKRGCTNSDMQNVFVAVNFEEESETAEADANDDDAMMRCVAVDGRGLWRGLWNGQTESGGRLRRARHRKLGSSRTQATMRGVMWWLDLCLFPRLTLHLLRFEFYEGIVRAAFGRFITTGAMTDASDATQRFIADVILPRMPPEALIDTNEFRCAETTSSGARNSLIRPGDRH